MGLIDDKKRIANNSVYLYILTFSNYFLGLLLYPYLSRVLSVDKFGLIGFSMSFATVFQVIIEYGFMISVTAEISVHRDNPQISSTIVTNTLYAKFILAAISSATFVSIAFFVDMVSSNFLIVLLFFVNSIFLAFVPDFYFRGIEKMKTISIRSIITRAVSYSLVLIFVKKDTDIILVPIFLALGNALTLLVSYIMLQRAGIKIGRINGRIVYEYLRSGFFFFLSRFAVSINSSLGSFALGLQYSSTSLEMGYFTGCAKLSSSCEMMLSPISDSLYPHMVSKKNYKLFRSVLILGSILWLVAIMIAMVFSETICQLVLGTKYAAAGKYLRILLIGVFFAFPSQMLGYPALSPIGKSKQANIAICLSSSLSIILCVVLKTAGLISLTTICWLISSINIVHVIYRGTILIKCRKSIRG